MEPEDLATYNTLASELVVYRGCAGVTVDKAKYGMSWTLDPARAKWFAKRFEEHGAPICIKATVLKGNVLAYFGGRKEQEIVIATGRAQRVLQIEIDGE